MKRCLIFIIILIFSLPLISAGYVCKDNSEIVKESGLIEDGQIEKINGLVLGMNSNKHFSYLGKSTANIMVDAKILQLSNETPSKEIEVLSVSYTVTMLNVESNNNSAKIQVKGNNEVIQKEKSKKISNIYVYLKEYGGDLNPSTWTVKLIAGSEILSLDTAGDSTKKVTIGNTTYLTELLVGYDSTSSISVYSCDSDIITTVDTVSSNETNVTNVTNETAQETNKTVEELNETSEKDNITSNISNSDQNLIISENEKSSIFSSKLLFILIPIIFLIVLFFFIRHILKKRKKKENKKEDIILKEISDKIRRENS